MSAKPRELKTKYAAHLIMAIRVADDARDTIPLYENVVLVYADTDEEAMTLARQLGRDEAAGESRDFRWGGKPARWEFVGVRKLIECRGRGAADRLRHGAEVTYSQMAVRTEADLRKLADGEPVDVIYQE